MKNYDRFFLLPNCFLLFFVLLFSFQFHLKLFTRFWHRMLNLPTNKHIVNLLLYIIHFYFIYLIARILKFICATLESIAVCMHLLYVGVVSMLNWRASTIVYVICLVDTLLCDFICLILCLHFCRVYFESMAQRLNWWEIAKKKR